MAEELSEELAKLRKALESHFRGDDEVQRGLLTSVQKLNESVGTLQTSFAVHVARYDEQQKRWRKLLDPDEAGAAQRPAPHPGLNGFAKQIAALATGAAAATAVLIEAAKFLAQHWAAK